MEKMILYCGNCKAEIKHPWIAQRCNLNGHELEWLKKEGEKE